MNTDDQPTVRLESTGSTALIPPRLRLATTLVWGVLVLAVLVACAVGTPVRYFELIPPAQSDFDCMALFRLIPAEQAALASLGVSMEAYSMYISVASWIMVLGGVLPGVLLFWKRRDSWMAALASLFLIYVACVCSGNTDSLTRYSPALVAPVEALGRLAHASIAALLLTFPSGRFVPRWTRWVLAVWLVYMAAFTLFPVRLSLWGAHPALVHAPGLVVSLIGVWSQVHRYRNVSTAIQRQQTKWVVVAFVAQMVVYGVAGVTAFATPRTFEDPLSNVAFEFVMYHLSWAVLILLPVAMMMAILRHRLWDIDFFINRSLVYGALTAGLAAVFAAVAVGLHGALVLAGGDGLLPVALGIAAVATGLLFQPLRVRLRRLVDRRLYNIRIEYEDAARARPPVPHDDALSTVVRRTMLGEYGPLELIGRGGMAEVYRARHRNDEREVAVKILPAAGQDAELVKRFEREARIIASLRHDHIVRMYEHGVLEDGTRFIIMEYVPGCDLHDHIVESVRLSAAETTRLLGDITAALGHAHAHGVIHRDVKPSNVLLDSEDADGLRAVLTDFGIAKLAAATQLTATNLIGTLDYISPEQIQDSAEVDERADIYSLGVMAYQMVTGRRPFHKRNPVALMMAHISQPAPDPRDVVPDLPDPLARGILRAMEKDPADRYTSVQAMFEDLSADPA